MRNLKTIELKTFIPAKNFKLSKQFYLDMGFVKASDSDGIAYFYYGNCSFLLQDFYDPSLAENLMMHLLVEDVEDWYKQVIEAGLAGQYGVTISEVTKQPWNMLDFVVYDPSGVLWRISQNI